MSFKKTVTFTAKVSDYTDGTVSARVQAENNILGQFVSWLLAQNTSIQQIEKVEIGDSHWSGYPMYAVNSSVPSAVSSCVSGYQLLSDVYMLGKNKNNFLMGLCVDGHILTIAPTCSFEFQDALNTYSSKPISIVMEQLRNLQSSKYAIRAQYGGSLPVATFNTVDDEISITLNYWKGSDTLVLYVVGETSRVFFSFDAVDASFGWLTSANKALCGYSFNEPIQADETTQTLTSDSSDSVVTCLSKGYATNLNPYYWGNMNSYSGECYTGQWYSGAPVSCRLHIMNSQNFYNANGSSADSYLNSMMETDVQRIVCCANLVNFPRISTGQLYLRKMYIPNRTTASPVKLGYTPGNLYVDAVYTVNDKNYVCLKSGWCSYFVEVSDQG